MLDAYNNNKKVLCVNHAPYAASDTNVVRDKKSGWNSWKPYVFDGGSISSGALSKVQAFINYGGKFICWLTGHTHFDNVLTNSNYPCQFMISIASANQYNRNTDGAYNSNIDSGFYDCFNYMGIDTTNNFLKIYRIGYNIDGGMKERNVLCYDYENKEIIWQDYCG